MKKLNLDAFEKANFVIEKKSLLTINGGNKHKDEVDILSWSIVEKKAPKYLEVKLTDMVVTG